MQTFIWTVLIYIGVEATIKIFCLAIGHMPPRNKGATAFDVVISFAVILWGAILLHDA